MSHPEQLAFFEAVVARNPALTRGAKIIEIGSYDVNGSIRTMFKGGDDYVGVDLTPGPGVDLVGYGHEVDHPDDTYDAALTTECFEHDPHWRETFANMVRMTRPGGLVVMTCASRGRPEHGTVRTTEIDSPGTQSEGLDYYRNLVEDDFKDLPLGEWFSEYRFWYLPTNFDLYFTGIKSGAPAAATLPTDEDVQALRKLMPLHHRVARLPLKAASAVVKDEKRYQDVILPYWLLLLRRLDRFQRHERTV